MASSAQTTVSVLCRTRTRVPNGKIAGTGATQADIGSIAKSARFDSDGNWRLQVYEVPMAEIDKKTQSSVLSAGMVVPTRGPGYQSYKVTAVTASAAQVTPAPAPAPAPSGGEVEEDEDDE